MSGIRLVSASSRRRVTFSSPVMPIEPAITVKSYAQTATAPVDLAVAGDHAVGGRLDAVHRALGEVRPAVDAELDERAVVDQQRDPLARGQLLARVLLCDLLLAAAEADLRAARVEVFDERAQQAWGCSVSVAGAVPAAARGHQRPFHAARASRRTR